MMLRSYRSATIKQRDSFPQALFNDKLSEVQSIDRHERSRRSSSCAFQTTRAATKQLKIRTDPSQFKRVIAHILKFMNR